jgi:hypothetical protein
MFVTLGHSWQMDLVWHDSTVKRLRFFSYGSLKTNPIGMEAIQSAERKNGRGSMLQLCRRERIKVFCSRFSTRVGKFLNEFGGKFC